MKPREEDFKRSMFFIKIDLDEINLNINNDQVKLIQRFFNDFSMILAFKFI
jgi:hypothetical protein